MIIIHSSMMQWVRTGWYEALFDAVARIDLVIGRLGLSLGMIWCLILMLLKRSEVEFGSSNSFSSDERITMRRKQGKGCGVGLFATGIGIGIEVENVLEFMKP